MRVKISRKEMRRVNIPSFLPNNIILNILTLWKKIKNKIFLILNLLIPQICGLYFCILRLKFDQLYSSNFLNQLLYSSFFFLLKKYKLLTWCRDFCLTFIKNKFTSGLSRIEGFLSPQWPQNYTQISVFLFALFSLFAKKISPPLVDIGSTWQKNSLL